MLCREGRTSLWGFLIAGLTTLAATLTTLHSHEYDWTAKCVAVSLGGSLLSYVLICLASRWSQSTNDYEIIKRAAILGLVFAFGLLVLMFASGHWRRLGAYSTLMATFHYSEYMAIAWSNPKALNTDTFMLNHSAAYAIAAVSSWIEFAIEVYFWSAVKSDAYTLPIGITICLAGEVVRKVAILTANSNFNHVVQYRKATDHELITHGVYKYMRHPSYAGWFWWSIGTQIVLGNPICVVLYALASWKFFHERIVVEEITLINFFQQKYVDYQKRTCTGVPFIKGFVDNNFDF